MDKRTVADVLSRFAFALELLEGGTPRARAYANASRTIWQMTGDVATMHANGTLAEVRGIGDSIGKLIGAVLSGTEPPELVELEKQIPETLFELRRIKGLGPAKIRAVWQGLGVTTLGELEYACKENRLVTLDGFGKKTQSNVLAAIAEMRANEGKLLRDQAKARLDALIGTRRAVPVGEYARGFEIITKLEILVVGEPPVVDESDAVPVVVHRTTEEGFGVEKVRLTSAPEHWESLLSFLPAHGLEWVDGVLKRGGETVSIPTADHFYAVLGLLPTPPERREAGTPLVRIGTAQTRLVELKDLKGALHNHTVASDGSATLEEMREAAKRAGLAYLGISEHSKSADYARGLSVERLREQRAEIARLNESDGPVLLSGVESDILADGALDYEPDVLDELEVVVASGHRRFGLDRERSTARMVRAASDRATDVMGHPTGRLLLGRAPNDFDVEAFLDACAKSGCAVELNGSPHRLDLDAHWLAAAKERGVLVSIAADAHATDEFSHLAHGVTIARRAGLTVDDVLNARDLSGLREWLAARRAKRAAV